MERRSNGATDGQSDGAMERRSNGATDRRSNGATEQIKDGATEIRSDSNKTKMSRLLNSYHKTPTVGTLSRDFLMPLLSAFWRIFNREARLVVYLGIRLMAWSADDDETALCNFSNFGRFVRMRRKKNKSNFSGFSGYGFLKSKTFGMYPLLQQQSCVGFYSL